MAEISDEKIMELVKRNESVEENLAWVKKLKKIALALGAEKTKSLLLPYLTSLCDAATVGDEAPVGDEVLTNICEELGEFVAFVGGGKEAYCLMEPLFQLSKVDETTVRDQAVKALNLVSESMSPPHIVQYFAPKVVELFNKDWWPPRVSAVGLVVAAFNGCHAASTAKGSYTTDQGAKECTGNEFADLLIEHYMKALGESEPMARRAAAKVLGDATAAFAKAPAKWKDRKNDMSERFRNLIAESEQESIRCGTLEHSASKFFRVLLDDGRAFSSGALDDPGTCYINCARDKSWRVRTAVAKTLPEVAKSYRIASKESGDVAFAEKTFMDLLDDTEAEVRKETAMMAAAAAAVLGAEFAEPVLEKLKDLCLDEESGFSHRNELSGILVEMAGPLGAELAYKTYLQQSSKDAAEGGGCLIEKLVNDSNTNLRLTVMGKLTALHDVVSELRDARHKIYNILATLCSDKNWRIRHMAMFMLPDVASSDASTGLDVDEFNSMFDVDNPQSSNFLGCLQDNCAQVRDDCVACCERLADRYGGQWLDDKIIPEIVKAAESKNYQMKAVLLHAAPVFAPHLHKLEGNHTLRDQLLPAALEMLTDRVANLRLLAAKCFGQLLAGKGWVDDRATVKAALEKAADDEDPDVKERSLWALTK